MRLFVAIPVPENIRLLLGMLEGGIPGARWIEHGSYHLTLRFLGELDRPAAEDVDAALAEIVAPAFDVQLSGVGQFNTGGKPRTLWAGVEPQPDLLHLARKVDRAVVWADLPPDDRNFTPHITIARLKNTPMERVMRYTQEHALFRAPPFHVDRFVLFESRQGKDHPVYEELVSYDLGEGA